MDVIEAIGNTPLIELKRVAAGLPVKVFIKCDHLNPGGSVKDRTARALLSSSCKADHLIILQLRVFESSREMPPTAYNRFRSA